MIQKKGLGKVGTDIFCHYMPAKVKSGILLINPNTGITIDPDLQGFYFDSFTIVVRNASITKSVEMANEIMDILPVSNVESDGVFFKMVRPMAMPITYPINDGSLIETGIPLEFAGYFIELNK
nr:minor capsid protein [Klebsiella pneumoniae]